MIRNEIIREFSPYENKRFVADSKKSQLR